MRIVLRTFLVLLSFALVSCAPFNQSKTVAGGEDEDIGLGGTGLLAGTGSGLGGTGVVGVITGFGSVFVNGIEIEYDEDTPFTIDGVKTELHELHIGDVVEVLTIDSKQHTDAQMINLRHEVVGRVDTVDSAASSFTISGQTIIQPINGTDLPEVGAKVAVSGFRVAARTVQATRVTRTTASRELLRNQTELPFSNLADRWLVQTHVKQGELTLRLDGKSQTMSVQERTGEAAGRYSGVQIIEVKRSVAGRLDLERLIEQEALPLGRPTPLPMHGPGSSPGKNMGNKPGSNMVPRSMHLNMNIQPGQQPGLQRGLQPALQNQVNR